MWKAGTDSLKIPRGEKKSDGPKAEKNSIKNRQADEGLEKLAKARKEKS